MGVTSLIHMSANLLLRALRLTEGKLLACLDSVGIESILESEEEGSGDDALGNLGSNAYFHISFRHFLQRKTDTYLHRDQCIPPHG